LPVASWIRFEDEENAMPDTSFNEFTLGKYRAVELLGKGGFGTVYRAIDTTLDREVALKVLHPQLVADPTFVERFRTEAKIIAALRHPNVVGVYELGEEAGRLFIAMEYMPGGTLKDRLAQRGRLSFAETLTILQQVCAGLEAAHAEGMLHRDIKPGNILFDKRGHAVVGDFGLARAMQLSSIASQSSSAGGVGTPFYKAPELWRGKPPASPATDVYALACMVYEMLTGRVLFGGDTPDEVIAKHLVDGPDFGTDWPPADAPQGLAEVIQRGIARNPEERFASAKALAEALNELTFTTKREAEKKTRREAEAAAIVARLRRETETRQRAFAKQRPPIHAAPQTTNWLPLILVLATLAVIALLALGNRPQLVATPIPATPKPMSAGSPTDAPQPLPINTAEIHSAYTMSLTLMPSRIPNTSVPTPTRTRIPANTHTNSPPIPTTGSTTGLPVAIGVSKVSGDSYHLVVNVSYVGSFGPTAFPVVVVGGFTPGLIGVAHIGSDTTSPSNMEVYISADSNVFCKHGSFTSDQVTVHFCHGLPGKECDPDTVFPLTHTWCSK
jgi:eukaryotic-like serine/threonine-protein kinase